MVDRVKCRIEFTDKKNEYTVTDLYFSEYIKDVTWFPSGDAAKVFVDHEYRNIEERGAVYHSDLLEIMSKLKGRVVIKSPARFDVYPDDE